MEKKEANLEWQRSPAWSLDEVTAFLVGWVMADAICRGGDGAINSINIHRASRVVPETKDQLDMFGKTLGMMWLHLEWQNES